MVNSVLKNTLKPVGSESVVDKTIRRIIEAISEGKYEIGQKLPNEYELISELQISRNSLREAMKILTTLGVVEIRRGDGTYVCDQIQPSVFDSIIYGLVFDTSSSSELAELRQALDETMIKLAMKKATAEDIAELQHSINNMEVLFKSGNTIAASNEDYNFHIKVVDICRNKLFSRIVKGVYQFFRHSIHVNITTEEEFAHATENHTDILNLIKNKQEDKVAAVVANTLRSWGENVKK
ncbi:MAG: FadR/GntR family transcriptional regulator [Eubacteriales bacterium]